MGWLEDLAAVAMQSGKRAAAKAAKSVLEDIEDGISAAKADLQEHVTKPGKVTVDVAVKKEGE